PYASDMTKYKGCYVWINNKDLIYVHYDGTKEDIHLNHANLFKKQIQALPKETIWLQVSASLKMQKQMLLIPLLNRVWHAVRRAQGNRYIWLGTVQPFCDRSRGPVPACIYKPS
ncbi:hypothetical protein N9Q05_01295, partial [bacterium]|nr:hypothetical protein [bacterium]